MQKVLVTGGAGFIGSNIVDKLVVADYQVVVVDNLTTGKKQNLNPAVDFYQLDITGQALTKVFAEHKITHVIHHAAQIDVQRSMLDPIFDAKNNILGTINLLEICRKNNVKKVIYASSAAVYGEPDYLPVDEEHPLKAMSPYGISKHTPEHYLKMYQHLYGLDYTILRYANVYGPRQDPKGEGGVVSIFVDKMLAGQKPVIFGDGEQTRDFIHVYDIANANLLALENADNKLINISIANRDSINYLVELLNDLVPQQVEAIYKKAREGDIIHSCLANAKAKELLGWEPRFELKSGLEQTVAFYN